VQGRREGEGVGGGGGMRECGGKERGGGGEVKVGGGGGKRECGGGVGGGRRKGEGGKRWEGRVNVEREEER